MGLLSDSAVVVITWESVGDPRIIMADKTSDHYKTNNIPQRFEHPDVFEGYGKKTSAPNVHNRSQHIWIKATFSSHCASLLPCKISRIYWAPCKMWNAPEFWIQHIK